MLLKVVLVFSSLVCFSDCAARPEFIKEWERIRSECTAEVGVSAQLIEDCNEGNFADDRDLKCYMHCIFDKFHMLNPDGSISTEKILNYIPESFRARYEPAIRTCDEIVGADTCETAFLTHKCYYATSPELYHLV